MLRNNRLCCLGYVTRMDDFRTPKQLLFEGLMTKVGKRDRGLMELSIQENRFASWSRL